MNFLTFNFFSYQNRKQNADYQYRKDNQKRKLRGYGDVKNDL